MADVSERVLRMAKNRAMARSRDQELSNYEQMAELFRRLSGLDERSLGPELARLQSISTSVPPQPFGFFGKVKFYLLGAVSPILGRLLKAASLAGPYQAAYELAVQMQERQLELESRICSELAALNNRLDSLESEMRSRRLRA